jgi:hypothetical protein
VIVRIAQFDDELARGIHRIYSATPIRQGRRFWHYGKDFETVKREHATYLSRSEFIGAYANEELIGFIKMVYVDRVATLFHIFASDEHHDKRPMNALVAKAVEVCAAKGMQYLIYGKYTYGNKSKSPLAEFKRRNGFQQIDFHRYYVPLTLTGTLALKLKLHRGLTGMLPSGILTTLVEIRRRLREKSAGLKFQRKQAGSFDAVRGESRMVDDRLRSEPIADPDDKQGKSVRPELVNEKVRE